MDEFIVFALPAALLILYISVVDFRKLFYEIEYFHNPYLNFYAGFTILKHVGSTAPSRFSDTFGFRKNCH